MGIFGARRARFIDTYPQWAADAGMLVTPAADMDDGDDPLDQARAFGARFTATAAPGAVLTIWAWPASGGPGTPAGIIVIGYRVHYRAGNWETALYHCDVACGEWYEHLADAEREAAAFIARRISSGPDTVILPDFYTDWDGRRF